MKFSLTNNASLKSVPSAKTSVFKHLECGKNMTKAEGGKYLCLHCMKTGYLLAKSKDTYG